MVIGVGIMWGVHTYVDRVGDSKCESLSPGLSFMTSRAAKGLVSMRQSTYLWCDCVAYARSSTGGDTRGTGDGPRTPPERYTVSQYTPSSPPISGSVVF